MDRHIETTGSAWFMTKAVVFPVQLTLSSARQVSNAERVKLSRAMEGLLNGIVDGGVPAARLANPPTGNPLQYLRSPTELVAETVIDCASTDELGQVHGLGAKLDHGEADLAMKDLPPVFGEHPTDRARAFKRALDAAGQAAAAISQEANVKLAGLISARELLADGAEPAMGEDAPRRIGVRLAATFAIG